MYERKLGSTTDYAQLRGGTLVGIVGIGFILILAFPIGSGNMEYFVGALATGIYFVGLNLVFSSVYKKDPKIQELSDKIDTLQKRLDELKL